MVCGAMNKTKALRNLLKNRHSNSVLAQSAMLLEWRFDNAWNLVWGDITSDERAVNGPVTVERVQKGDQKAFNLLVVRYQHKVASLVSRYVPSGDVPDVVQESFIKAYRALDSFRG